VEKQAKTGRNGFHRGRLILGARRITSSNGLRVLSDDELKQIIDRNAQKYLGMNVRQFLRRLNTNRPVKSPAWGPIEMMASLLRSDAE
jgi:hypothetical protein